MSHEDEDSSVSHANELSAFSVNNNSSSTSRSSSSAPTRRNSLRNINDPHALDDPLWGDLPHSLDIEVDADDDGDDRAGPVVREPVNDEALFDEKPYSRAVSPLVQLAATHVETGLLGRLPYLNLEVALRRPRERWRVELHRWRANAVRAIDITCAILLLLTFFERPSWCFAGGAPGGDGAVDLCDTARHSGVPRLDRNWSLSIELVLLFVLLCDSVSSLLVILPDGRRWAVGWFRPLRFALLVVSVLDVVVFDLIATPDRTFRLSPYLRAPILVCTWAQVRRVAISIGRALPRLGVVLLLQSLWLLFAAWTGLLLFGSVPNNVYFDRFGDALWNLMVLTTTANFPDVAVPALNSSVLYMAYFFVYLGVSLYLLTNLALATIFAQYSASVTRKERKRFAVNRITSFSRAFDLLLLAQRRDSAALDDKELAAVDAGQELQLDNDEHQALRFPAFAWLCIELNRFNIVPHIDPRQRRLYFKSADISDEGTVMRSEFMRIAEVLDLKFTPVGQRTWLERQLARCCRLSVVRAYRRMRRVVLSQYAFHAIDVLVVLNTVLLAAQQFTDVALWSGYELVFALIYGVDQLLKIVAFGSLFAYWRSSGLNRFDLGVTVISIVSEIIVIVPNSYNEPIAVRLVEVLRALRFLRLFHIVPTFRAFTDTYTALATRMMPVTACLLLMMLEFALIGVNLFGGMSADRFDGSAYAKADFFALNFNDIVSGSALLFALLVVNNWFVLTDGFVVASGTLWARAFFVSVQIVGVIVLLNVVVATIVQQFAKVVADEDAAKRAADEAEEQTTVDPSLLTGIEEEEGTVHDDTMRFRVTRRGRQHFQRTPSLPNLNDSTA
jgi:hypothetical protein